MKPGFKETRKFLNAIDSINYGGCGFSALALYDAAKRDGLKPKIVYLYHFFGELSSIEKNNKFKEGKIKTATSCSHVLIKIGNKLWDSSGVIRKSMLYMYNLDEDITREHLVASINNKGVWNPCFEREFWAPRIQKYFKRGTTIKI
jgi:hypothetical protein